MDQINDYRNIKNHQVNQYDKKQRQYRTTGYFLFFLISIGFIWIFTFWLFLEIFHDNLLAMVLIILSLPVVILFEILLCRLRRNAVKSAILLRQLTSAIQDALNNNHLNEMQLQQKILEIETKFLANDDELFIKKFMWQPYLQHVKNKADDQARGGDGKVWVARMELPPVWLEGDALKTSYKDRNIVLADWKIRLKLRELWFYVNYHEKYNTLTELSKMAQVNVIVFERFLRSKKISKYLKEFKTAASVFYLTPAAKMRLVTFVNDVISDRPYKTRTPDAEALLAEKNEQIDQYISDFWKVHRKSLKFYFFEAVWLGWVIPVVGLSAYFWYNDNILRAALTFFIGAALVVYGEMMLVTRQMIFLKGKKLMPPLIASLIAIRHSMCKNAGEPDMANKYRKYFKNAEKHFILTTNEIESVKYVQDNLKEKKELAKGITELCQQKKVQLKQYYNEFNHYRRQCLKFGCLEAFVALMVIPVYAFTFWLSYMLGIDTVDIVINLGYWGIGIIMEIILIRRHIVVWRYKELYLLLYQELSVTLADPDMMDDTDKLVKTFQRTESDALEAAEMDGMDDAVEFICNVSRLRQN